MPHETLFVLDHIQGPLKGSRQVLTRELHGIGTGQHAFVHFPSHRVTDVKEEHATLTQIGDSYQISSGPNAAVFVNGIEVHVRLLADGDLIRIGESGPLLRYREVQVARRSEPDSPADPGYKSIKQVVNDCVDVAKENSASTLGTGFRILRTMPREITSQASPVIRIATWAVLLIIVVLLGTIVVRLSTLESRMARQAADLVDSVGLVQEENRISVDEMRNMRDEVLTTAERLELLENESDVVAGIVGRVARATVFVQAAYGFSDPSGRMLRATVGPDGQPFRDSQGQMIPTFGGSGPILERQYTGTAFVVSPDGLLMTNHHVAEPWLFDEAAKDALDRGFEPVLLRMIGFLPERTTSFDLRLVEASGTSDLALLQYGGADTLPTPIVLSDTVPELGQSIMVLGYPTGIQALLARTDRAFVDSLLQVRPEPDFWAIARELAGNGFVAPLITRGIVGQITPTAIVYDAETTHGGSGGPVITLDGRVIAVNTAILGDFGGSNLGVPILSAQPLLIDRLQTDR